MISVGFHPTENVTHFFFFNQDENFRLKENIKNIYFLQLCLYLIWSLKYFKYQNKKLYGILNFSILNLRYNSYCAIRDLKISEILLSAKADRESFMESKYAFSTVEKG